MKKKSLGTSVALKKSPTGICGFDEITGGGLPAGRPTLVCGGAGCGKSMFAVEFLVRGAMQFGEPGVLMTFEEGVEDMKKNVSSLGFDLDQLIRRKKLAMDHVEILRGDIQENGDYDLEGLFIRLDYAIKSIGAKRVVLDTIEALFAGLSDEGILRAELRRLFTWLKSRGVTTVITGERGDGALTRHGLEEYVSDCVVLLDHRVEGQMSTRRLRVVKYRGSHHGTNEYPFLIDEHGLSVMPITGSRMDYPVTTARVSSGIPAVDRMLGGRGFYRGSTILLSGTAGTGKSSIAASFANAACDRGERCLYFSFEESPAQILRNMRSIGLQMARHVESGLLQLQSTRPTVQGFEMHLLRMHDAIRAFRPRAVVIDPIFEVMNTPAANDSTNMLIRLIDGLRSEKITAFIVSLSKGGAAPETTEQGISSMVDAWLLLRDVERDNERTRAIYVLKCRGMAHSRRVHEFKITSRGIALAAAEGPPGSVHRLAKSFSPTQPAPAS